MSSEALVSQCRAAEIIGGSRLQRWVRGGFLEPAQRSNQQVLFRIKDIRACLRRLENGEICPPDQIESARTNGSAIRHGRGYVKKGRPKAPGLDAIVLDFSAVNL